MALDLDDRKCKVCGKIFTVLYPDRWAYKTRKSESAPVDKWFCSWHCLREDEKRHEKKIKPKYRKEAINLAEVKRRDMTEVLNGVLDAIDDGRDPRAYLKGLGYQNPSDQFQKVLHWAEKNNKAAAEKLHRVPKLKRGRAKQVKTPAQKTVKAGNTKPGPREPIAKVEKVEEKNGGIVVTAKKLPPAARPKTLDGSEWQPAPTLDFLGPEHILPQPVSYEDFMAELPQQKNEKLKVAGLESRAIEGGRYVRTGKMITLMNGEEMSLSLICKTWKDLAKEIDMMIEQFEE